MRTSTWVKYLPALARMATPAMAVTWAAVKTTGAAPAAAMVRPKVASDLGTRVTIIRSEASPSRPYSLLPRANTEPESSRQMVWC